MAGAGEPGDPILGGIKPQNYYLHCGNTSDCKQPFEHLSVYIFRSKEEQAKGLADFNKQKEQFNENIPVVWGKTNTLVVYWRSALISVGPGDEEQISQALVGWVKVYPQVPVSSNEVAVTSSCEEPPQTLELLGKTYRLDKSRTYEPGNKIALIKCEKGTFSIAQEDSSFYMYTAGSPLTNSDILFRGPWGFALFSPVGEGNSDSSFGYADKTYPLITSGTKYSGSYSIELKKWLSRTSRLK